MSSVVATTFLSWGSSQNIYLKKYVTAFNYDFEAICILLLSFLCWKLLILYIKTKEREKERSLGIVKNVLITDEDSTASKHLKPNMKNPALMDISDQQSARIRTSMLPGTRQQHGYPGAISPLMYRYIRNLFV